MGSKKKTTGYVIVAIIFFFVIPEIAFRTLSPEHLAWLGFMTSFGGVINPLLSVMIFMGVLSVVLGVVAACFLGKIYRVVSRSARHSDR